MKTEKRWIVTGSDEAIAPLAKGDAEAAAADARERMATDDRKRGVERDITVDIAPVEVLVDAFNVVSKRDGEVVIREVPEDVADHEMRRLQGQQADDKAAHPIHALIPDEGSAIPGEPPALVPHDPTPHPGYEVVPAPERTIDPEEA